MKPLEEPAQQSASLPQRQAFLVQLSPSSDARATFVGRVSHVVSARSIRFASPDECLAFIARVLEEEPT